MPSDKLTDREAKNILLEWPGRTKVLWPTSETGYWLRCQPLDGAATAPRLTAPGADMFKTQPDGLWAYFKNVDYCDLVAVEVCGTMQNLNDKRSRYILSGHSMLLVCSKKWFLGTVKVQKCATLARWKACGTIEKETEKDIKLPVRYLRVLYALPTDKYDDWRAEHIPSGHEFFCRHPSLSSHTAPKMRRFLRRMAIDAHFYTT